MDIAAAQVVTQAVAQAATAKAEAPQLAKVDNGVRQALSQGSRPDVLVHFSGRADVSAAQRMPAQARAAFVHRTLSSFADGIQAPARSALQGFGRQPSHLSDGAGYMVLWLTNSMAVPQASEAEIEALAKTPGVVSIEQQQVIPPQPDIAPEAIPAFSLDAVETSVDQINAPAVWALGFEGTGITVGNVDSGVRHTHQALVNQYRGNTGSGFAHDYNWFDPYSFSTAPRNTGNHGSHTMGTMVGDDGGTNQVGVAPGADWIACIGFGGSGGSATDAGLIACNQFMVAPTDLQGENPNPALAAHVSNNSWGNTLCNGDYDNWYEDAVDGLVAAGVVPVWSMGNASNCSLPNNPPLGQNSSPSNYGKVFSVGSTGKDNGQYAGHSIKGPTTNPSLGLPNYPDHFGFADLKPNVVAPGVNIRSTIASSDTAYGLSNGTSMSAPAVAGMVALIWNAAPCLIGDYPNTGSLIMSTASPVPVATGSPSDGPGNVPNQATGWGEVDALAAVNAAIQHCALVGGPDPVILVSPAAINLNVFQDAQAATELNIINQAGGTLDWSVDVTDSAGSCASPNAVDWLEISPTSGSNGAGGSAQVAVDVDAAGLALGAHSAVLCVSSNDSTGDTLIEVPVNIEVEDPDQFPLPYCSVDVSNTVEPISRVVFGGIDNLSSAVLDGSPAHEDFVDVLGAVETGASFPLRVEGNTGGNYTTHVAAYFDWNRDGDFGDAGETQTVGTLVNSSGSDGKFAQGNIAIPESVTSGPVRMRISKQFNSAPSACGPISWGQSEDYTVEVTQVTPEIALAPAALSFDTTIGGGESQDLSISNVGTGTLNWAIGTANVTPAARYPRVGGAIAGAAEFGAAERVRRPFVIQPMADCAAVPGQIVHDDGSVENGYSGNPDTVSQLRLVDRFTPAVYPALLTSACVSFISQGPTTLNYNVVVYDDDGAGGSPGTRIGAVAATATGIPVIAGLPTAPSFYTVDLSGLGLQVEAGSVYVGVEYAPVPGGANIFVSSDQSATNPVAYAGGYFYTDSDGIWGPIEDSYPDYRSLMVRAALPPANPEGCDIPATIPWLSVSPSTGSVPEGQATTTAISVDASGMAPGLYEALLCVASNDRENSLIEYPVELRVRPTTLGANINVTPTALTATLGDTQITERSIQIGNTGGATLDWEIGNDLLRAPDGVLLYAQDGNPGSGGVLSLEDLSGPAYSTQAADDFVVPAGALWVVDRVVATGIYDGLVNPAAAVNVSFHADAGGMPGAVVAQFDALLPTEDADGVLTLDLPQGVSLEEGSWWLSVQPAMDFFADGSWNWMTQTVSTGAEFHWQNPGGGYGGVCTSWAPGTSCGVSADTDLTFALYGAGADTSNCALPGWISIDPMAGTVASGATDVLDVTLDSTGLADGVHSAAVCIDSNDPGEPRVVVPVNITVDNALQQPVIDVDPEVLSFTVAGGASDVGAFSIANLGSGSLDWTLSVPGAGTGTDPALDEVLPIPDFTFSGGATRTFTVPAGVATSGPVLEFTFQGTAVVAGFDWPSDTCLQVTSPEGAVYLVGGFIGSVMEGCGERDWADVGSSSGTYTSYEANAFPGGTPDEGVWTFMFVNDYSGSGPVTWSDVSITLHKTAQCSGDAADWLGFNPASGSTYNGNPDQVDVTVDTSGMLAGEYEGTVCVNSNDTAGNAAISVPVQLTVLGPEITVDPESISDTLDIGDSASHAITIGNAGAGELVWTASEAPNALDGDTRAHFPVVPFVARAGDEAQSALSEAPDPRWLEKLANEGVIERVRASSLVPSYSGAGYSRADYVSLDAEVPGTLTSIVDPGPNDIYAATFVDNDFSRQFFIATGGGDLPANAYGWIDTATGAVTQVGTISGGPAADTWTTMAWDSATNTVFAVTSGASNQLWTIDPVAGTASLVGTIAGGGLPSDAVIIGSAFDSAGLLYVMDIISDTLVAVDKSDAAAAVIGPTGVAANFAQDMDFDRSTGVLYWAGYQGGGNSQMFTIDTVTGAATSLGNIQDGAELISFRVAVAGGNCTATADVPWIALDNLGGTIVGGGPDQTINVTLDSTGLPVGVHQASICIDSNDVERPTVEVPVTLTVESPAAFIEVTPESLSTVIGIGLTDTQQLQVANLGYTDDLVWTITEEVEGGAGDCSVTGDVTWLSTSTGGEITSPDNSTPVDVTFDATGMADGIYTANLCVASSDLLQPMVIVPVTMEVDETIGTPEVDVAPTSLAFSVEVGAAANDDLAITNTGTGLLEWQIGTQQRAAALSGARNAARAANWANIPVTASLQRSSAPVRPFPARDLIQLAEAQMSQTVDTVIAAENTVACPTGPNGILRRFYFGEHPNVTAPAQISSVDIAIEAAIATQTLTVNLYTIPHATPVDTIPLAALTPIGTAMVQVTQGDDGSVVNIPLDASVADTAGFDLVVEVVAPGQFFIGSSTGGETHPGFIVGPACGITEPTPFAAVDPSFDNVHVIMVVNADGLPACEGGSFAPWLSVDSTAGGLLSQESTSATVTVDSSGLAPGTYEADMCVASNDATDPTVLVPVTMTVTSTAPFITVDPAELSAALGHEASEVQQVTIGNLGGSELTWSITEEAAARAQLTDVVLFDQTANPGTQAVLGNSDPSFPTWNVQGADDFVVPTGSTWEVTSVAVQGQYDSFTAPATSIDVFIYADAGGSPGSQLHAFADLAPAADDDGHFTVNLPSAVTLVEGTYWLSVQPEMDFSDQGEWYWWTEGVQTGAPAHWRNPADGAGTGCTDWDTLVACGMSDEPDLTFQVIGNESVSAEGCSTSSDIPGLSVAPGSGTVAPDGSAVVDVTFDSTGVADGTYSGNLCLTSNAPNGELVIIPVELVVDQTIGSPEIAVTPAALDFQLLVDGTAGDDLDITNTGTGRLDWSIGAVAVETLDLSRSARAARTAVGEGLRSTRGIAAGAESRMLALPIRAEPVSVLVVSPDVEQGDPAPEPPTNLVDDLGAFPDLDVSLYEGGVASITAATLAPYDVVIVSNNTQWAAAGADVSVGDALADYIDGGGKVVTFNYAFDSVGWELAGRFITDGYGPFELAAGETDVDATMVIDAPAHPVLAGVGAIGSEGAIRLDNSLTPGAELLASWSDGLPLAAANDNVVAVNMLYGALVSWTGDLDILAHNAVVWLAGGSACEGEPADWLSVGTTSGQAFAGETDVSAIQVDASGLAPGTYQAKVCVESNAATSLVEVPVTLTVAAEVNMGPEALDGGTVGIAYAGTLTASGAGTVGPFTFEVTGGALPAGISLASDGGLSGTPAAAGAFSFTVMATDSTTRAYSGSRDYDLSVAMGSQAVDFPVLAPQTMAAGTVTVAATATSGLPVAFASNTPGSCSVAGDQVSLLGVGICTVLATQPGDSNWMAADGVTRSFLITQGDQSITFGPLGPKTLDDAPFTVAATASSGLAVAFASDTAGVCTVAGDLVSLVDAGTCTIRATQAGDANWTAAVDVTQSFEVGAGSEVVIEIGPEDLVVGKVMQPYLASFTASGAGSTGPFTYEVSVGDLPAGIELSTDGELSGTPVVSGDFTFTILATDSSAAPAGPYSGSREYTLTVLPDTVFADGFEGDGVPTLKLAGDGAELLSVPLLDLLAGSEGDRVVTAAVLESDGKRVGLVQARCMEDGCTVRVLHMGNNGSWSEGDWMLVEDEPFELQLFIEQSRVTDATRGRSD